MKPLKKQSPSSVSWADLIQMGGALAVEACGGPHIEYVFYFYFISLKGIYVLCVYYIYTMFDHDNNDCW